MTLQGSVDRPHSGDQFYTLLGLISITYLLLMLVDLRSLDSTLADWLFVLVTAMSAGMLIAALWTSGVSKRLMRVSLAVSAVMVIGSLVTISTGATESVPPGIIWVLLVLIAPVVVVRQVMSHEVVRTETIVGAVCAYLLIALGFSYVYLWIDFFSGPFFVSGEEASTAFPYFSLVTITTLGYGDLAPASAVARALATVEALTGQIFLVVFVARLVSVASSNLGRAARQT